MDLLAIIFVSPYVKLLQKFMYVYVTVTDELAVVNM